MITPDLEKWLNEHGYEHYVFVSYPRVPDSQTMRCARAIAEAFRQTLSDYTTAERCRLVFVDDDCLELGADWEPKLKRALCRSVVFVAVCGPVYYRQKHRWCGREYQAMLSLLRWRQAGAVIPLLVRKFPDYPLPPAIGKIQYFDLVDEVKTYRNFARRARFQQVVETIIKLTAQVGNDLKRREAAPSPPDFQFPDDSAFDDYDPPGELPPLRSE